MLIERAVMLLTHLKLDLPLSIHWLNSLKDAAILHLHVSTGSLWALGTPHSQEARSGRTGQDTDVEIM